MTAIRTQYQLSKLIHSHHGSIRNAASVRVLIASYIVAPNQSGHCIVGACGERLYCYGSTMRQALEALARHEQSSPRHIIIAPPNA